MKNRKTALLLLLALSFASAAAPPKAGKTIGKIQRLLYVTDKTGISVYDINDAGRERSGGAGAGRAQ